jgi:hypothetical protein
LCSCTIRWQQMASCVYNRHPKATHRTLFIHHIRWCCRWVIGLTIELQDSPINWFSFLSIPPGRQSCRDTFHSLYIKFDWRYSSSVSTIFTIRHALWGHRLQKGSDIVRKIIRFYLWIGWNFADCAATYDTGSFFVDF